MLTHKVYRFLFLLPILLMIAFSLFFSMFSKDIESNLLNEKFMEKKIAIASMAYQTDEFIKIDNDWEDQYEYYKMSLIFNMELLEQNFMTYAVVFDEMLKPLSKQLNYMDNFDPTIYPSFITEVRENEIGDTVIHFKPGNEPETDMLVHYRWIPSDKDFTRRFLVVVAISKNTITNHTAVWFKIGSIVLIGVTTLLNVIMVAIISFLVEEREKFKKSRAVQAALHTACHPERSEGSYM